MNELTNYELGTLSLGAVVAGIWMLVKAGDWTIEASVSLAQRFNLSRVFIGATIIAFGTSVPELFTSVNANFQNYPGISLGNIIGSNIANVLMVLGAAALICTLSVKASSVARDLSIMTLATAILIAGFYNGVFERWMGVVMFCILAAYVFWQFKSNEIDTSEVEDSDMSLRTSLIYLAFGFFGLAIGSEMLVRGAVVTGQVIGIPEAIIGMTAVAIGTSLPELTASMAAAAKREIEMMFGNIIGSNTFNILSIVALTSASKPLIVDVSLSTINLWFMAAVSGLLIFFILTKIQITRNVGLAFLATYAVFTLAQFYGAL